jgi:hypothetical protein
MATKEWVEGRLQEEREWANENLLEVARGTREAFIEFEKGLNKLDAALKKYGEDGLSNAMRRIGAMMSDNQETLLKALDRIGTARREESVVLQ